MRKIFNLLNPHQLELRYTTQLALGAEGIPRATSLYRSSHPRTHSDTQESQQHPITTTDCGTHWPSDCALTLVHPNFLSQESTKECSLPEWKDALERDQRHQRTNHLSTHRSPGDPEQPKPPDLGSLQNSPGRMAQLTRGLALKEVHGIRLISSHYEEVIMKA